MFLSFSGGNECPIKALKGLEDAVVTGLKCVDDARLAVTEGDPESLGEALNGIMGMLATLIRYAKSSCKKKPTLRSLGP